MEETKYSHLTSDMGNAEQQGVAVMADDPDGLQHGVVVNLHMEVSFCNGVSQVVDAPVYPTEVLMS